jgi:type IV secretory pathway VirB10-like protein
MSILANVRELLDAVLPPAQATATQATPVAPAMPTGTIPRKKRNQVLIAGGAVVLVIGFFIFHRPAAQEPVVRSRSQNTQPTTTLTPEQVTQSGVQLANDTRVAIEHENQLKNLSVAQFGNDPANTGMVDPNTGQRINLSGQDTANYQTQAPAQTGPTPEQIRHEKEVQLAKALHASPYIPPTAMSGYEKPSAPQASPQANQPQDATSDATARPEASAVKTTPNDTLSRYEGPLHRVLAGQTILRGVMKNRIEGSYDGPVVVQLTDDLYSANRQQLLAKAGTILFGTAIAVSSQWQSGLEVRFNRLIMPDGFSVELKDQAGLSQGGEVSVHDRVNRHYASTFTAALLIGGLGALTQRNNGFSGYGYDPVVAARNGITQSLGQASERILDRSLNRPPTLEIREGTRVAVILSQDLVLPEYRGHLVDPNL